MPIREKGKTNQNIPPPPPPSEFPLGNPLIKCSSVRSPIPSFSYTTIPSVSSKSSSKGVGAVFKPIPFEPLVGLNDRERLGRIPGPEDDDDVDDVDEDEV